MGIRTKLNPMGGSNGKYYTLTIVTDPAAATCTLTINGIQYVTKTKEVKENTVVSYSVNHSTYGTKTGSITLTSDTTLTFTGDSSKYVLSNKLQVNGALDITGDGIASGFSTSNYIRTKNNASSVFPDGRYFGATIVCLRFKFSSVVGTQQTLLSNFCSSSSNIAGVYMYIYNSALYITIGNGSGSTETVSTSSDLNVNTQYQLDFSCRYSQSNRYSFQFKCLNVDSDSYVKNQSGTLYSDFDWKNEPLYIGVKNNGGNSLTEPATYTTIELYNFQINSGNTISNQGSTHYYWNVTQS